MLDPNEIIFSRRNSELSERQENWNLIYRSYIGGVLYLKGNYLSRYPKESLKSFGARKNRAVYFNQMSPIVDMLSGLLFLNKPTRNIPKGVLYLEEEFFKGKSIDESMRLVAAYSFMFTVGLLVDSPDYDVGQIRTEKDRRENKINPYVTMYLPEKIRDFSINRNDGELEWVILDNSYTDNSDPKEKPKDITKYTLWTRGYYQNFEKEDNVSTISESEKYIHNLGYVPFKFVSWRDDNNDFVSETVCEDIAMISKLIYNNMSYMDEMLASGTFKMLVYPSKDGNIPTALQQGGVGALGIIPYDGEYSTQPSFIGASLEDIDPFIKAISFYMAEILKKIGLNTDETKEFVKSGAAKKIDFQKMRSLLVSGSMMMGKVEKWCYKTAAKWQGSNIEDTNVEYTSAFSDEDLELEVTMLTELLVQPVKSLRTNILKILAKKLLTNYIKNDELEEIYKDIEKNIGGGDAAEKTLTERIPGNYKANTTSTNVINEGEQDNE